MYHTILPIEQHSATERFLLLLPVLVATSPLCRHLKPVSLLMDIAPFTLTDQPHSFIVTQFNLSPRAVLRRDNFIRQLLTQHEPEFYQAVLNLAQTTPDGVSQQAQAFKLWLKDILSSSVMACAYCGSLSTVRIGHRLNFRCRSCRRTFNPHRQSALGD